MYLLVFVLNKDEYLNQVLEYFVEIGIKGATILDSKGMGRTFMSNHDIPVVGGIRKLIFFQSRPSNKTIFSVIESKEKAVEAMELIEQKIGSLKNPGAGIAFILPLEMVKGLPKEELVDYRKRCGSSS